MFHKGDTIVATREAETGTGMVKAGEEAVVLTDSREPWMVTLRRRGKKTPERWAADFWRKRRGQKRRSGG